MKKTVLFDEFAHCCSYFNKVKIILYFLKKYSIIILRKQGASHCYERNGENNCQCKRDNGNGRFTFNRSGENRNKGLP